MKTLFAAVAVIVVGSTAVRAQFRPSTAVLPIRFAPIAAPTVTRAPAQAAALMALPAPLPAAQAVMPDSFLAPVPALQPQALVGPASPEFIQTINATRKVASLAAAEPAVLDQLYTNTGDAPILEKSPVSIASPMRRIRSGLTAALVLGASLPLTAAVDSVPAVAAAHSGVSSLAVFAAVLAAGMAALFGGFKTAGMSGTTRNDVILTMLLRGFFAFFGAMLVASVLSVPLTFGGLLAGVAGLAILLASWFGF